MFGKGSGEGGPTVCLMIGAGGGAGAFYEIEKNERIREKSAKNVKKHTKLRNNTENSTLRS